MIDIRPVIDIRNQIDAIERQVSRGQGPDGEDIAVLIRRSYDAPNLEVWNALTDPERMKRWFYPASGDLRPGDIPARGQRRWRDQALRAAANCS